MTRYRWKLRNDLDYEPCTELAREAGCTCSLSAVHATDIDPPEPVINRDCPIHGIDVDYEVDRRRDDAREAARDIEEDRAEDYRDDLDCEDGDVGASR